MRVELYKNIKFGVDVWEQVPDLIWTRFRGQVASPLIRQILGVKVNLRKQLARDSEERIRNRNNRIRNLESQRSATQERRDKAYTDKIDGKISEARWLRLDGEWEAEILRIDNQIKLFSATTEPQLDRARETFELLKRAPELYLQQTNDERAKFLKSLLSNCLVSGDKLIPTYNKPFDAVAVGLQTDDWYPRVDEFGTFRWPSREEIESLLVVS